MIIKDKIEPLWNTIKESLDLKGKYIRFKEYEDQKLNECMLVDYCRIDFEENNILYEIVGTRLTNIPPYFSLINGSHTYYFTLDDLLNEKCGISIIEEITKEEFESILDDNIESWKKYANENTK